MKVGDKILILVILLVAVGLYAFYQFQSPDGSGKKIIIEVDGVVVKTFDLPQEELVEYKVEIDEYNYNLIQIFKNRVRVAEATCPEQIDVLQGWIEKPGEMLVCLPHKLIVKIVGEDIESDEVDVKTY
ncbi:hypothetical protein BBF96_03895 [Anoxybacter fermentans]|uniref:Uncharacterized protein n=1 Tax=Anoxybacter fermentans TaxID=1323375 RepID=A0A3S9SWA7_9FIRM|nr:NusG domain II-containing protein [Anoxybacter fermentans]AZR72603.1 hypothetical protein BBF96_03895 [Anoxybacter fermentans]